ncbi:MAG: CPBP family intramembrane metalloprotease, partial [Clostridia bacterium]|nr:CPBP family intramembrane metalloprotease [Clostridia bacterium]
GSAFLFGMLHGNFAQIPFAFVVGLILAYVRIKTESMLPGILIHFGNNFYAVTATILSERLPEEYGNAIEGVLIILLVVIGFASIYYLTKNKKELFDISPEKTLLTFGEKIKVFFSAGTVIACIVILSLMSIAVYAVSK